MHIQHVCETKGIAAYRLVDMTGKIVAEKSFDVNDGLNNTVFDLGKIAKGIYMLNATTVNRNQTIRIVVQ